MRDPRPGEQDAGACGPTLFGHSALVRREIAQGQSAQEGVGVAVCAGIGAAVCAQEPLGHGEILQCAGAGEFLQRVDVDGHVDVHVQAESAAGLLM